MATNAPDAGEGKQDAATDAPTSCEGGRMTFSSEYENIKRRIWTLDRFDLERAARQYALRTVPQPVTEEKLAVEFVYDDDGLLMGAKVIWISERGTVKEMP